MIKPKKDYECFPIDSELAENFGEGYYYCSGNTNDFGDGYEVSDSTEWFIHPNGTFSGGTSIFTPNRQLQEIISFEGTFEKSKYNDYLKQMQDGNEEWTEELVYTLHIL